MEIEGTITFLVSRGNRTTIEIHDSKASVKFVEVTLTNDQLASALSRIGYTDCEKIIVHGLHNVGKIRVIENLDFEMPKNRYRDKELARKMANSKCPEGWKEDTYFGSQDSFYTKDGRAYARTSIVKWIEREEE